MSDPAIHILILGASTRAAACSALRAGLTPHCADLFADADLQARCPVLRVPRGEYPHSLPAFACDQPAWPWIYTGALENRPALVGQISGHHKLWGNDAEALALSRSPMYIASVLQAAGLPGPAVHLEPDPIAPERRWLVKPLEGSAGAGIRFWSRHRVRPFRARQGYFQEFIDGEPCAAIYEANASRARLLGVTRQLIGEAWLHSSGFHYCGSIGPLYQEAAAQAVFARLGQVLASACRLRGLFGVDCVLRDGIPWPVEINPRYTASVEVLEYATGISALAMHRQTFDGSVVDGSRAMRQSCVGKAILFARQSLTFPADGPWIPILRSPPPIAEMPLYADIPHAGESIEAGQPILTLFVRAGGPADVIESLRQQAADLDRWLFGGSSQ